MLDAEQHFSKPGSCSAAHQEAEGGGGSQYVVIRDGHKPADELKFIRNFGLIAVCELKNCQEFSQTLI